MSSTPKVGTDVDAARLPMTLPRVAEKKRQREAIVMVTAYDYPSGAIVDAAGADIVLVGDSARRGRARLPLDGRGEHRGDVDARRPRPVAACAAPC